MRPNKAMSPFCSGPAWRWQRANFLMRHGKRPSRSRDDDLVREAVRFLRDADQPTSPTKLDRRFPLTAQAVALQQSEDPVRRWIVEAYLLAAQAPDMIATKTGVPALVIQRYHDLFYDVQDCLDAIDYIASCILAGRKRHQIRPDDVEYFLKLYGYRGGPLALEDLLKYLGLSTRPISLIIDQSPPSLDDQRLSLSIRAALLARSLPADMPVSQVLTLQSLAAESSDPIKRASQTCAAPIQAHREAGQYHLPDRIEKEKQLLTQAS